MRLAIGAPHGRSGKTTITLGLVAALKKRGLVVQPFKKGPDFIDPGWLSLAAGRNCRSLDLYFLDKDRLVEQFVKGCQGADIAVIEGAMGLYDGLDLVGSDSTAAVARAVKAPIVLVIDATRMTRSAAAMVKGFQNFEPETEIAAVILNKVARPRHEDMLRNSIEAYTGIPVLGSFPKHKTPLIAERHLGLVTVNEWDQVNELADNLGLQFSQYADLNALLDIASAAQGLSIYQNKYPANERGQVNELADNLGLQFSQHADLNALVDIASAAQGLSICQNKYPANERGQVNELADNLGPQSPQYADLNGLMDIAPAAQGLSIYKKNYMPIDPKVRIGIIKDNVFSFYYPENLDELEQAGAELVFINSLEDSALPDIQGLYIGGGFPELFGMELEQNVSLRTSIRKAVFSGLPVYAECGGLMYLSRRLYNGDDSFEMCGVLPCDTKMSSRPKGHGYTEMLTASPNYLFEVGSEIKGHEFHHSQVCNVDTNEMKTIFKVKRGCGIDSRVDGIIVNNVIASYNHLYAPSHPEWAKNFVARAGSLHTETSVKNTN